ncbi:MAG: hypothetical protein RLZZ381_1144 [Cyanobacteriota bacterium]|jgi:hypothetical protein
MMDVCLRFYRDRTGLELSKKQLIRKTKMTTNSSLEKRLVAVETSPTIRFT